MRSWLARPAAVPKARLYTRTVLTGWHCFPGEVSAAEATVSELVTNAVEASKEEWTVTLRLFAGELSLLSWCGTNQGSRLFAGILDLTSRPAGG